MIVAINGIVSNVNGHLVPCMICSHARSFHKGDDKCLAKGCGCIRFKES